VKCRPADHHLQFAVAKGSIDYGFMMERKFHPFLLAFALAVLGVTILPAKKPKPQAKQLMERAHRLSDFRSKGSEPFRLRADFTLLDLGADQQTGTYSLLWLSPEKWREEISLHDFTQVRILLGQKLWRQRSGRVLPYAAYLLQSVFNSLNLMKPLPGEKYSRVRTRNLNGKPADCFKVRHGPRKGEELCFEPTSGVLLSIGSRQNGTFFSDYEQWGSHLVPQTITTNAQGSASRIFEITDIESPRLPDAAAFTPPTGSIEMPGCQNPTLPTMIRGVRAREPSMANLRRHSGMVQVLGEVGADGKFHLLHVIRSPDKEVDGRVLRAISRLQYKPATCDGTPVPSDLEIYYRPGD
jgi:hypothetical protein